MRVLITGADGLVGAAVAESLREAGHTVTTLESDARDASAVASAVQGIDAVAHLAAIADPNHEPPEELFANNTQATFTVLWTAATHGVRRFAIASSVNATGLLLQPGHPAPDRYPVGIDTPQAPQDPYSLSKAVDEETLFTVCDRFGASGVAIRLPLIVSPENFESLREWANGRLEYSRGDGWGWLDARDAAETFVRAITVPFDGAHVVHVAAEDVFADESTDELLNRYAPNAVRDREYLERTAPIDTMAAIALLGFSPRHRVEDVLG